jgi:hypothetical protein
VFVAYCVIAVLYSAMLVFSGITKLQHHPQAVAIIHDLLGVPLAVFPLLAACEFAGAIGLLSGIRWQRLGVAAAIGLILYFVGAILSHVRVGDFAGLWSAVLMLVIAVAALLTRMKAGAHVHKRIAP